MRNLRIIPIVAPCLKLILIGSLTMISTNAYAAVRSPLAWLNSEAQIAGSKILQNTGRSDTAPGVVIASPSKLRPDYYYHWIRDAALTMDVVVTLEERAQDQSVVRVLDKRVRDYISFSIQNQNANSITGLGEPKFYVDGRPYELAWGRPQNDGPALRAITLIHYAKLLIKSGRGQEVAALYDSKYPSRTPIKKDLEYVSNHWRESSFDLWEEVLGDHFYTRMVQRKALMQGADFARSMGDQGASDWYIRQAQQITASLESYWNANLGYIQTTLNWKAGVNYKTSNLDVATVLGVLHGTARDGFYDYSDQRVANNLSAIIKTFSGKYEINNTNSIPGYAIGRYPEDQYDGDNFQGGNPWVLATLAVAETYYELAARVAQSPGFQNYASQFMQAGDAFVARVQVHANPDGSLSEQISKKNGYMTSAVDLTWNYAAVFTTLWARERAVQSGVTASTNSVPGSRLPRR